MTADSGATALDQASGGKLHAATVGVSYVQDGMIVGLGSGSTAEVAVELLGRRVTQGLRFTGVATSRRTERLARAAGIRVVDLNDVELVDITLDGADEVDLRTLDVIKGRGGALLREKLVAIASDREIILVDTSKVVDVLGTRVPVPVEVVPFGWRHTMRALEGLGARVTPRGSAGALAVTDGANFLLDCAFGPITDAPRLAAAIKAVPGVVESGLFITVAHQVLVAGEHGVANYSR